jgi:hypothetical protein
MGTNLEVHDRIVAQLQRRNCQLEQEKAEVELRLRQATALLSELQSAWMDLPPEVAASIGKILAKHSCLGSGNRGGGGGGDGTDSVKSACMGSPSGPPAVPHLNLATNESHLTSRPVPTPRPTLNKISKTEKGRKNKQQDTWAWLGFDIGMNIGCAPAARTEAEEEDVPKEKGRPPMQLSTVSTPQRPAKAGSANLASRTSTPVHSNPGAKAAPPVEAKRSPSPSVTTNTEVSLWPSPPTMASPTTIADLADITDTIDCNVMPMHDMSQPTSPFSKMGASVEVTRDAMEVSDLLCDVPGASTLVAEIDVLCSTLQSSIEVSHDELEQRIKALKEEISGHRKHLDDTYMHTLAAQSADLALCKAQLCEATTGCLQMTTPRITDCCEKAGQAHVDWLDECIKQRIQASEAFMAAKKREFAQDVQALWERKSLLTARIRAKLSNTMFSSKQEDIIAREVVHLRKTVQELEAGALVPLGQLAASQSKDTSAQSVRLASIAKDSQSQVKATTAQLSELLRQCRSEMKLQSAMIHANKNFQRRELLTEAFGLWIDYHVEAHLASKDDEALQKSLEALELKEMCEAKDATHADLEQRLQRVEAARKKALQQLQVGTETPYTLLAICFGCWESQRLNAQLASTRARAEQRLLRAFETSGAAMLFMQAGMEHHSILSKAFVCWEAQRIAGLLAQKEQQVADKCAEAKALAVQISDSKGQMDRIVASRSAVVGFVYSGMDRQCMLTVAFARWLAKQLDGRLASRDQALADGGSEVRSLGDQLQAAAVAQAELARRMERATAGYGAATCYLFEDLERRFMLVKALGLWMALRLEGRIACREQQAAARQGEAEAARAELKAVVAARALAEQQKGFAISSRSATLQNLHTSMESRYLLTMSFSCWCSREVESRADSMRQELARTYSKNVHLDAELRATKSSSELSASRTREQSFRGAHALLAKNARCVERGLLAQVFGVWSAKRLEAQVRTAAEELDVKRTLEKQLSATQTAVTIVHQRGMHHGRLLLAWHGWASWRMRRQARRSSQTMEEQKARVNSQMAELRVKAAQLFNEYTGLDAPDVGPAKGKGSLSDTD